MSHRGLEWARQLQAELTARIANLREALADIEPLREELRRLEAQLRGVDRLLSIYHDQFGFPTQAADAARPVAARQTVEASPGDGAIAFPPVALPLASTSTEGPAAGSSVAMEALHVVAAVRVIIGRALRAARRGLINRLASLAARMKHQLRQG